ncbi:MAG: SPFH domain-containing protein, partial [Uliginosibacterium sp.]|nr:SPFH domain-containing protein [Uliginosibacterium sp.]
LDMAANQMLMSDKLKEGMLPVFERYGLALDNFAVENVSLPEELQKAIDTRISMGMMGDLNKFTQYQMASSIPLAAQNEGGLAGIGAGLAAGVGVGQMMANTMGQAMNGLNQAPAAAAAPAADDPTAKLGKLKVMLDQGLITQTDYDTAKADVLKKMLG